MTRVSLWAAVGVTRGNEASQGQPAPHLPQYERRHHLSGTGGGGGGDGDRRACCDFQPPQRQSFCPVRACAAQGSLLRIHSGSAAVAVLQLQLYVLADPCHNVYLLRPVDHQRTAEVHVRPT